MTIFTQLSADALHKEIGKFTDDPIREWYKIDIGGRKPHVGYLGVDSKGFATIYDTMGYGMGTGLMLCNLYRDWAQACWEVSYELARQSLHIPSSDNA